MEQIRNQSDALSLGNSGLLNVDVIRDGPNGPVVVERRQAHNLVVNDGKLQLVRLAVGNQTNVWDQFRIGTSGQAAAAGDTNVLSPVASTLRTADTKTIDTGRTMQLDVSYASGGTSISATGIREVAILNQNTSPGGSAFARAILSPAVNKTQSDKLSITYKFRVT